MTASAIRCMVLVAMMSSFRPAIAEACRRPDKNFGGAIPVALMLVRHNPGEIHRIKDDLRRMMAAKPVLDSFVDLLIVDDGALPAHAADDADGFHFPLSLFPSFACHGKLLLDQARDICAGFSEDTGFLEQRAMSKSQRRQKPSGTITLICRSTTTPFSWPIRWKDAAIYYRDGWLTLSESTIFILLACVAYLWFSPSPDTAAVPDWRWIGGIWLRNLMVTALVAGVLHYYFYHRRAQAAELRYVAPFLSRGEVSLRQSAP